MYVICETHGMGVSLSEHLSLSQKITNETKTSRLVSQTQNGLLYLFLLNLIMNTEPSAMEDKQNGRPLTLKCTEDMITILVTSITSV
jgi:hypothetical protein